MEEMLTLRKEGWSLLALAHKYNRCHATVLYHCKRNGIQPEVLKVLQRPVIVFHTKPIPKRQAKPGDKYLNLIDEPVNNGKSYRQYRKESLERAVERRYEDTYGKFR